MTKRLLLIILFLLTLTGARAQVQFWSDNFEDAGAPSSGTRTPEANSGSGDSYFLRTNGSGISVTPYAYSGMQGSKYWAGEDHDGLVAGQPELQIVWSGINIAGRTSLQFSGLFAAHDGAAWEATDYMMVEYSLNGTTYLPLLNFQSNSTTIKQLSLDTDNNNVGDGTPLNYAFAELSKAFTVSGSQLWLRIRVSANGLGENWAIDNFRLSEAAAANTAPSVSGVAHTGTLHVGQLLSGSYTYADADNNAENGSTFSWYRSDNASGLNKAAISGASATSYTTVAGDLGKYISFEVTPRDGTVFGTAVESTRRGPVLGLATLSTSGASTIGAVKAVLGGNVSADGGAAVSDRGIVWATTASPTTSNNKIANGSGTGSFSGAVSGLPAGTMIYFRAYAINSVGTSYGTGLIFTTSAALSAGQSSTPVSCFSGTNGTATVSPSGGLAPYSYSWSPSGASGATASGLSAGSYTCTITDSELSSISKVVVVGGPASAVSGSTSITNVACFGSSTGAINLTPTGGTGPYTFNWGGGVTTEDRTLLSAGTYSVTITDVNGCTGVVSGITVGQPASAVSGTTSITSVSCFGGNNGAINLTPTGGTGPYTFNWGGGVSTEDRTGLAAGTYSVTITDVNGCTGVVSGITVGQPSAVVSGTTSITNVACFGGNTGAINLTPAGGTGPYTFNWGGGVSTEDRTLLPAGTYSVTITDVNGCTGVVSGITVGQPTSVVSGTASITNVACFGGSTGSINLTPTGGTGPYTFNWGGGVSTEDRTGLAAGIYSVTITDENGCTAVLSGITVGQPAAVTLATATLPQGNIGAAYTNTFLASGGSGTYSYTLSAGALPAGLSLASTGVLSGTPSGAGVFNFEVKATESGCGQFTSTPYTLTVNTGTQVITFNALANKTFGDAPFALSATGGGSGNPVTYVSSNTAVATISGSTVTLVGAGTTTITASQAGSANYTAAAGVDQSLTVGKAAATLTLSGLSQSYDGSAKTVVATTTPAGLSGVSITYDGSATVPSAAGTYAVVASLSNSNYNAADATGSLVIGKQSQAITFNALANKTFGDASFALNATGGASGNTVTYTCSNSAVATISGKWDPLESTCRHASLSIL